MKHSLFKYFGFIELFFILRIAIDFRENIFGRGAKTIQKQGNIFIHL